MGNLKYYNVVIRYGKMSQDKKGESKLTYIKQQYLINADSISAVEQIILKYIVQQYVTYDIVLIKQSSICDVISHPIEESKGNTFYIVVVKHSRGQSKKLNVKQQYLVKGKSVHEAQQIAQMFLPSIYDEYQIHSVKQSNISAVLNTIGNIFSTQDE